MAKSRENDDKKNTIDDVAAKKEILDEAKIGLDGIRSSGSIVKLEPNCATVPPGFEHLSEGQYFLNLQAASSDLNMPRVNSKDIPRVNSTNQDFQPSMTMNMSETQHLPFSTQKGLETTTAGKRFNLANGKQGNVKWSHIEDKLLIRAWLNSSKPIVGNNHTNGSLWRKIDNYYNKNCKVFPKRYWRHLKDRWQRLCPVVSRFSECYEQSIERQRSSSSENDIMEVAHQLYKDNYGKCFTWEHAWECLKDEPKWIAKTQESSKKRKSFCSVVHPSSSNREVPATTCECDPTSPLLVQVLDQKPTERKVEEQVVETYGDSVDAHFNKIQEIAERRAAALEQLARAKEESTWIKKFRLEYEILVKDTSQMAESQRKDHEMICAIIRKKFKAT